MRIGKLKERIIIRTEGSETADGGGGYTQTPTTVTTVWGQLRPLSGREVEIANAQVGIVTHEVTIRYLSNVTTANHLKIGSRLFNIKSVMNVDEADRWLRMKVEEGVAT